MNANNVSIWNICSILLERHPGRVKRFDDGYDSRNYSSRKAHVADGGHGGKATWDGLKAGAGDQSMEDARTAFCGKA